MVMSEQLLELLTQKNTNSIQLRDDIARILNTYGKLKGTQEDLSFTDRLCIDEIVNLIGGLL
jgi:hypothetical protein